MRASIASKCGEPSVFMRVIAAGLLLAFSASVFADPASGPSWWYREDLGAVIDHDRAVENKAVANIGQAKWVALRAVEEFERVCPIQGGRVRAKLFGDGQNVGVFSPEPPSTDEERARQCEPLLIGQLKNIALPFYDEFQLAPDWLQQTYSINGTLASVTGGYPWQATPEPGSNRQVANLGQLKALFSLDFQRDLDNNGFYDLKEELFAGVDSDGDGLPDGNDLYPTDRFNGEAPLLLIDGEWTVAVRNKAGSAASGVNLEFRRWPSGASSPQSAVWATGQTGIDGKYQLSSGGLGSGDRVVVNLAGDLQQKVYLPWKNGSEIVDESITPGGAGLSSSALEILLNNGVGLGYPPKLDAMPGGGGSSSGSGGDPAVARHHTSEMLATFSHENTSNNYSIGNSQTTWEYSPSWAIPIETSVSPSPNGPIYNWASVEHPFMPTSMCLMGSADIYKSPDMTLGPSRTDMVNQKQISYHGLTGVNGNIPLRINCIEKVPVLGRGYTYQAMAPREFNINEGFSALIPQSDFPINESAVAAMIARVEGDVDDGFPSSSTYQQFLVVGPVRTNMPKSVLCGGSFYFSDINKVNIGAMLPTGFPNMDQDSYTYDGRPLPLTKIRWKATLVSGAQKAAIRLETRGGGGSAPFASPHVEIEKPSEWVNVAFQQSSNPDASPFVMGDSMTLYIQAELLVLNPAGTVAYPLGDLNISLVCVNAYSPPENASLAQAAQMRGAIASDNDVEAIGSTPFFGGQLSQTLESERRIGITGQPYEGGDTFVDSLTKRFHHSETDFHLSIPGSDLSLSVARSASESIWTGAFGLRPSEDPLLPFGPGWRSNIAASILVSRHAALAQVGQPQAFGSVNVTDYLGQSFQFSEVGIGGTSYFTPDPTLLPSRENSGISLTRNGNGELILNQPTLGISHCYEAANLSFEISANRDHPSTAAHLSSTYYRLKWVKDRFNTTLKWRYDLSGLASGKIVPDRIEVEGRPGLCLRFEQGTGNDAGRVQKFWDPSGVMHSYAYSQPLTGYQNVSLEGHSIGGVSVKKYGYKYSIEDDTRPSAMLMPRADNSSLYYQIPTQHFIVDRIIDGAGNELKVNYSLSTVRKAFSGLGNLFYPVAGDPMLVDSIDLPGPGRLVEFGGEHSLKPAAAGQPAEMVAKTEVIDFWGNEWLYNFSTPVLSYWSTPPVDPSLPQYPRASALFYPSLTMSCEDVPNSEVTFRYDATAGFAVNEVEDAAGRKRSYSYDIQVAQPDASYTPPGGAAAYNSRAMEPTGAVDVLGFQTVYRYTPNERLLRVSKDHLGRVSEIGYDTAARPTVFRTWTNESAPDVYEGLVSEIEIDYHPSFGALAKGVRRKAAGIFSATDPQWVDDITEAVEVDASGFGWPARRGTDGNRDGDLDDPEDFVVASEFSAAGRLLSEWNPNGGKRSYAYDSSGKIQSIQLENGATVSVQYDRALRPALVRDPLGAATGTEYDHLGRPILRVVDLDGDLDFDVNGGLTGVDLGLDSVERVAYLDAEQEVRTTDARGFISRAKLDPFRRVTKSILPAGDSPAGLIPSEQDGIVSSVDYDFLQSAGGPVRQVDALGYETINQFDGFGRLKGVLRQYEKGEEPLYQRVRFGYNAQSGLREEAALARTPVDRDGDPVGSPNVVELVERTLFDILDRPLQSIQAAGTPREIVTRTTYTSTCLPWKTEVRDRVASGSIAERWIPSESVYDGAGRLVKTLSQEVVDASTGNLGRPSIEYVYNASGEIGAVKDSYGSEVSFGYDVSGNVIYRRDPQFVDATTGTTKTPVTRYFRDAAGQITQVLDPLSNPLSYTRDLAGRVKSIAGPAVAVVGEEMDQFAVRDFRYDPAGNIIETIDPRRNSTFLSYDSAGQLVERRVSVTDRDPSGLPTVSDVVESYSRDVLGQVTKVLDGRQCATGFSYDGIGRQISRTWDPDEARAATEKTIYDGALVVANIDAELQRFDRLYDSRFSLQSINVEGKPGENLEFGYDDLGRVTQITPASNPANLGDAEVSFSYDQLGRQEGETSNGVIQSYRYDLNGNLARVSSSANSRVLMLKRDVGGRVIRMDDSKDGATTSSYFGYDVSGRLVNREMPNGLRSTVGYDAMGRVTEQTLLTDRQKQLYRCHYSYDLNSNISEFTEWDRTSTEMERWGMLVYDEMNRLVSELLSTRGGEQVENHRYDKSSNRISTRRLTSDSSDQTELSRHFHYAGAGSDNNSNQLSSISGAKSINGGALSMEPSRYFAYDKNGNRIKRWNGSNGDDDSYSYDSFGRLTELDLSLAGPGENGTYRFAYDPLSRRVGRQQPDQSVRLFAFSGNSSSQEWTPASGASASLTENIGGGVGGRLYSYDGGSPTYQFYNSRGDLAVQSTQSGSISYRAAYSAGGKLAKESGSRIGGYGPNSKWTEPDGLINDGYRYRDSSTGTFLSRDPAGFVDGLNVYNYMSHNPWSGYDPNGLSGVLPSQIGYTPENPTWQLGHSVNGNDLVRYMTKPGARWGAPLIERFGGKEYVYVHRYSRNDFSEYGAHWFGSDISIGWELASDHALGSPPVTEPSPPPAVAPRPGVPAADIKRAAELADKSPIVNATMAASRASVEISVFFATGGMQMIASVGRAGLGLIAAPRAVGGSAINWAARARAALNGLMRPSGWEAGAGGAARMVGGGSANSVAAKGGAGLVDELGSVIPKGYQGGPGAMWTNEGRGLWNLTTEGADKVMTHGKFGTFYRSSSDGLWWAADNAGHGGSAFKVFKESGKGLEWYRDADQFGDFIVGKHKGATGQFIPWNQMRGR